MKERVLRRASLTMLGALLLLVIPASSAFAASTVDSVTPSAWPAGRTINVQINGSGYLLTPTVSFGTGISVSNVAVQSLNVITATLTIASNAPTGFHTVTVSDSLGTAHCNTCFTVTPPPTVSGISPASIGLGAGTKHFTITGTGFLGGATVAISGTGVSAANPAVTNSTTMTVDLTVSSSAVTGARRLTVFNPDGQSSYCDTCFGVMPAPRAASTGFTPAQRGPGLSNQPIDVIGTGFAPGITVTVSGTEVTVNSVTYKNSSNLQFNVSTAANAPLGAHDVTFANMDGGRSTCVGCFSITGPTMVSIAFPSTLNGSIVGTFTQPVGGVSSSNSYVRVTGQTSNLAATITCLNASGVQTSCASGRATKALLRPNSLLTSGQHYSVTFAASGAHAVTDFGGLPVAQVTQDFPGGLVQQGESVASSSTWRRKNTASAMGDWLTIDHLAAATAAYGFNGSSITWFTTIGPNYGIADLYVDGVAKATVNCYRSTTAYRAAFTLSGLTSSHHTLVIRVRGVKGSSRGTGSDIAVDAFRVGSTTVNSPAVAYTWGIVKTSSASAGAYARSDEPYSTTSFRFRGTKVEWDTVTGPGMGRARVYIDGVLKGTVDNYSAISHYNVAKIYGGLTDALHTIAIVVTGTRQSASTGTVVAIDRWVVT
jgi:hypothetical protein